MCEFSSASWGGSEMAMRLCDLGFNTFADALPQRVAAYSKSVIYSMGCGASSAQKLMRRPEASCVMETLLLPK